LYQNWNKHFLQMLHVVPKVLLHLSKMLYMYVIMLLKQFSNIEKYVKYALQIFDPYDM
jgi:hypothetical protein